MDMSLRIGGNFLTKHKVAKPLVVTVAAVEDQVLRGETQPKPVLFFEEVDVLPLPLNKTNIKTLVQLLGKESDDYVGKRIVVFNDPEVEFNGEKGGLRLRAPKTEVGNVKDDAATDEDLPF